jgi:hypothetical protein
MPNPLSTACAKPSVYGEKRRYCASALQLPIEMQPRFRVISLATDPVAMAVSNGYITASRCAIQIFDISGLISRRMLNLSDLPSVEML